MKLADFQITDEARAILSDHKQVSRATSDGKTLQELCGFSKEVMSRFYTAARNIFLACRYEDSEAAFTFLTTVNPLIHAYWLGLAMSQQSQKKYEEALLNFGMAALTDISDPVGHFYMAKCYYAIEDHANARAALDLALTHAQGKHEHEDLLKEIQDSLQFIKNL